MSGFGTWTALYVVAAVVDLLLAAALLRRREATGAVPLAVFLVAVAVGATSQGMVRAAADVSGAALWFQVGLVGTALVPVGWIYFAVEYAGREAWTGRRTVALLSAEPVALLALIVVPGTDGLLYTVEATGSTPLARIGLGPATLVHMVYYLLALVVGTVLFLQLFVRARHLYRGQAAALLFGASIPWVGHLLSLSEVFADVRLTPFLLTLSGAAMTLAVYRFRLLDPVPVARESVFEEMSDGVLVVDDAGRVGEANPAARSLLAGDGQRSLVGESIGSVVPGWQALDEAALREGWEELTVDEGEDRRHVELQVSPFRDRHDELVGRLVHVRDVTARKRREQWLARFKTIFESVDDAVFVLDAEGRFLLVNEPMAAFVGTDPAELEGSDAGSILDDGQFPRVEESATVEVTVATGDGPVPCEARLSPVEFEGAAGTVGVLRDVSRRKRAERNLAETSERLETLVAASPLAILALDEEGHVEVWNPAAEEIFGWTAEEVRGEVPPMIPEDAVEEIASIHDQVLEGERFTDLEVELLDADGDRIDASVSIAPVTDRDGNIQGSVAVIADLTERKERERRLRRQNERLDQFAGIVSHDLRNPLQVAKGNLQLHRQLAEGDESALDEVETSLDRMQELIDDLLTIARDGQSIDPGDLEPTELRLAATEAWGTVDTGRATLSVDPDAGRVLADPSRLREILENLFRNSIEHGRTDEAQTVDGASDSTPTTAEATDGAEPDGGAAPDAPVSVEVGPLDSGTGFFVADDGPGIPEDRRSEVFESGVSTDDDGTGLGLAIVSNLASAHDWDVTVTESAQGGARFEFRGVERP